MTHTTHDLPPTASLRLRSRRVLLRHAGGRLGVTPAAIDVAGSFISAVHLGADPGDDGVPETDLGDRLVTPAFIDGHTHLNLSALRGLSVPEAADNNLVEDFFFRVEGAMTPEDVRAFVRMGAYEALLHGTALVWDHYYHPEAVLAGLRDVGLPAVLAPTLQDVAGPGVAQLETGLAATEAIASDPALAAEGLFAALGPHATDTVSPALFRRVADAAERLALPVHCHVAQSLDELERVKAKTAGGSPVQLLRDAGVLDAAPTSLLVHNIFLTREDVASLPSDRVVMAFCPHSKQIFAYLPDIRAWHEADLRWLVATDCAASNDGLNVQRELRAAAGMRVLPVTWSEAHQRFLRSGAVVDARAAWAQRQQARSRTQFLAEAHDLLSHVWEVPGAMHPAFTAGVIAPGALANLAIWDLDHPTFWPAREPARALAMSDTTGALWAVMAAGRWAGEPGRYAASIIESDAYRAAHREASERLDHLERRAAI